MKKILCLLLCLMLLLPLAAAKAEMLPVENETPVYPMMTVEDEEPLAVEAAGTNYYNTNKTVQTNKEYTFGHNENSGLYSWYVLWSTNGSSWTTITGNSFNDVNYRSSNFSLRANYRDLGAYITFYTTGTFYIRVITTSRDSYTDTIETYCFTVEQGIQPSLSVTPSSVSLTGGSSTQLSLNGSYVSSYDFYSSNPSVASVTYNNGSLILEAWNTGTATIRFTGYGNYGNASASCQVTVTGSSVAKPISYCSAGSIASQPYTGSQIRPSVVVKDEKTTLTEGVDYTLSYANNINPGTATVTVIGIGNYSGRGTVNFTITQSLTGASVTLSGASNLMYDGTAKRPAPTVTLNGKTLTEGTDYSVSYSNNTNAGTATVTITGIGTYTSTVTKTFLIHKAISDCTISAIPDQYFTGEAICPDVTIKDGTTTLVNGTDYTLKYSNNTNIGTATVTITGREPYTGQQTVTFQIKVSQQLTFGRNILTVEAGQTVLRRFVPEKDGDYTFYTAGSADTYGILYDSNLNVITSDDNSGPESNFNITCSLKANTTYYVGTRYYSSSASGTVWLYTCNMRWSLSGGVLTITGNGPMPDFAYNYSSYMNSSPWADQRATITEVRLSGVTSIGDYAFCGCSSLTSITIPTSIRSIGEYAFDCCRNLINLTIPQSVTSIARYSFRDCSSLKSVTILAKVTSISEYAFLRCGELTNVTIPDSVTSIGYSAFDECSKLSNVQYSGTKQQWISIIIGAKCDALYAATKYCTDATFTDYSNLSRSWSSGKLTITGSGAMREYTSYSSTPWYGYKSSTTSVVIGNGILNIGSYAFDNWSTLTSITIPNSVTTIGANSFSFCSGLTNVTIPDSVTSIGEKAFTGCSKLASVAIPNSVTSIGDSAFSLCSKLASVTIPASVTSMGRHAFASCNNLTKVTILNGATCIGSNAFNNCINLTSVTIPQSVTSIGSSAFYKCSSLTNITIPYGITSIEDSVFMECSNLTSVTIPDSVTNIKADAFSDCSKLTSVTIPASVTSIGNYAFVRCSNLQDVWYLGSKAQWNAITMGTNNSCLTNATIHCLGGTVLELPASLRIIQSDALQGVSANVIHVPAQVTEIQSRAFADCKALTSIVFKGSPDFIADDILSGCSNVVIIAPRGSSAASWASAHSYKVLYS